MIRSRSFLTLGAVFFTLPALAAQQIKPELGAALTYTSEKNPSDAINDQGKDLSFSVTRARLNVMGDISESLSYHLLFDVASGMSSASTSVPATATTTTATYTKTGGDSAGKWVEFAYIDHKVADMVTLRYGKQQLPNATAAENFHDWDDPIYWPAYEEVGFPVYGIGVGATVVPMEGQEIRIVASNSGTDSYDVEAYQKMPAFSLGYNGSFVDGMVKPMLSYNMFPRREIKLKGADKALESSRTDSRLALGAEVNVSELKIQADYWMSTFPKINDDAKAMGNSGFGAYASYKLGGMMPFLNYGASSHKYNDGTKDRTDKASGLSVGIMFEDESMGDLRYSLAYQMTNSKADMDGAKDMGNSRIWLGVSVSPTLTIKE